MNERTVTDAEFDLRPNRNVLNEIARKKLNAPTEWQWCKWKAVSHDCLLAGGVPRYVKSGKNKGQKTWRGVKLDELVIARTEIDAANAAYEKETGNCHACIGTGEVWAGSNFVTKTNTLRTCSRCGGTGKAKVTA